MNIKGKIVKVLPLQKGVGRNGEWRKQSIVLETQAQYPKKICVSIWGELINYNQIFVGNDVDTMVEFESREYNEKWYTEIRVKSIIDSEKILEFKEPISNPSSFLTNINDLEKDEEEGDLPF